MKNRKIQKWFGICGMALTLLFTACHEAPPVIEEAAIIPLPMSLQTDSTCFVLPKHPTIGYTDATLKPAAELLASILSPATGYKCALEEGTGDITLSLSLQHPTHDAYTLVSNPEQVTIQGNTYRGVVAGIQSLRQLFPADIEYKEEIGGQRWGVPSVTITDAPKHEWRGLMLDVSRHFFSVNEVKELLDVMSLYKLNKFHWHLTDDQGWRIEIKKYPLLTEKGAWRKFNKQDKECLQRAGEEENEDFLLPQEKIRYAENDTLYGGFYTQEDIKDIVAYAQVRGIDVIPEIDMPGHMLAAISNYKGVSCFEKTGWGETFSSPVCPGKNSALTFCKNVYQEIFELFPYEYVHIGGDEVEKTYWKTCKDCQKRMKQLKLQNEDELQSWFTKEMERFFLKNNRKMIGWDEIIEGGLSKTSTVMWWRGWAKNAPQQATEHGNAIIITRNEPFYLDYQQDSKSLRKLYEYNTDQTLKNSQLNHLIRGVQGNIWTEGIPSRDRMYYMAAPRMQAIAEVGWSSAEKDWEDFTQRLSRHFERLNVMDIEYRVPDMTGFMKNNVFIGTTDVKASCTDGTVSIHYTTDGSTPTIDSPIYNGTLTLNETTDLTFRLFRRSGKASDIIRTRFISSDYLPAATVAPSNPGLQVTWYDYKGEHCSEIDQAPMIQTRAIEDVKLPGWAKAKRIGLIYRGYLNIPADDIYSFSLSSDDGSTLKIDNQMVVENDGMHATREESGQCALKKGHHAFEVRYFDFMGGTLDLKVMNSKGEDLPYTYLYAY